MMMNPNEWQIAEAFFPTGMGDSTFLTDGQDVYFKPLTNSGAWSLPNRGLFALDTTFVKNHGGQPSRMHRGHAPCSSQLQAKATICNFLKE
jgi:hypothetical protein